MEFLVVGDLFENVQDPRMDRSKLHLLSDILMIVLISTLCGCQGWDDMADFAEAGEEQLRSILELPHGIPCADTLRRTMTAIDSKALQACLMQFSERLCESMAGKQIAIDGKTVRGSFSGKSEHGALHLVSAWATEQKLVLAQVATNVKSNEITAIPELLELLDLRKVTVTTDAMGCQKAIAEKIIEKGGEYLFGLKGNQPTLQEEVVASFNDNTRALLKKSSETFHESVDKGHGRLEVRRTLVLTDTDWIAQTKLFPHARSCVLVESERTIGEETSIENRFYISSRIASAELFANLIRSHWGIENNLHWVLDVTFGEDAARVHRKNGAENLAVIRKIALTLLQNENSSRRQLSIARKRKKCSWSYAYLQKVLCVGTRPKEQAVS